MTTFTSNQFGNKDMYQIYAQLLQAFGTSGSYGIDDKNFIENLQQLSLNGLSSVASINSLTPFVANYYGAGTTLTTANSQIALGTTGSSYPTINLLIGRLDVNMETGGYVYDFDMDIQVAAALYNVSTIKSQNSVAAQVPEYRDVIKTKQWNYKNIMLDAFQVNIATNVEWSVNFTGWKLNVTVA